MNSCTLVCTGRIYNGDTAATTSNRCCGGLKEGELFIKTLSPLLVNDFSINSNKNYNVRDFTGSLVCAERVGGWLPLARMTSQ